MKSLQFQKLVTLLGVVLFGIKLIAWRITGSNAIFSDTMESTVNIVAAFMGWYSLYLCAKPRDTDHPYGHGKVEFVTSGIEGILIVLAGILILIEAISAIIFGINLDKLDWGIALFASTAVVNYIMGYISYQKGKKENSLVLMSAGKHLQSDTFATISIVFGLLLVHFTGWKWLDPLIAIFFGSYIIVVGYQIVRKALGGIMDEQDEALFAKIVQILQDYRHTEWIDIHNMRIQQFGVHLHIDAHQEMEKVIKLLAQKVDRTIEFNFHMDYCKDFSCELCSINCNLRKKPFVKTIIWNEKNMASVSKHKLN